MKTDYSAWTMDALQKQFVETGIEYTRIANERQGLIEEMDRRTSRASAVARIGAMSDADKDALREVLDIRV